MPQIWLLGWLTILTGLQSTQQTGMKMMPVTPETPMTPMAPVSIETKIEMISNSAIGAAHNGQVCSTWGNFHFSTFDGDFFQLPYSCNYILTTMCDSTQSEFNIQMRREYTGERPEITAFTIKLGGIVIMLQQGNITVNNKELIIPGYYSGIRIERMTNYIKIQSKLGLTVFWDEHNSLSIEISKNYRNQTCGLCGDFNGILKNEFIENGQLLTPEEFGYKWKMDLPTETCVQTEIYPKDNCQKQTNTCQDLLYHPAFESCHNLLPTNMYLEACLEDLCQCNSSQDSCLCDTLSEFSRQCAHAGGTPASWRSHKFCGITCPLNMVHSECGSPCTDTCSNQEGIQLCADHCVDGCVCPPGTVLDDINNTGCIPVDECPCTHNGKTYSPGESFTRTCQDCVCSNGRWNCITLDCSGTCSLLGGSHVITYDGKAYNFHGNCDYVLSKHNSSDMTVFVHLAQCGVSESETCLTSVKFIISNYPVTITSTGNVLLNDVATKLPVVTNQVKLFKPSTFFIIAQTPSIQIIVQLVPVMQVYLEVSSKQKGTLSGLCGNFNDKQGDDFKAKSGLIEGTATTFASTWKTALCQDFSTSLNDPCSMSVEKEKYAMEWCQMLRDPAGAFAPCHVEINPKDYVKRCKYDACVCAHSEDCMCAAVSSYVHACAARGVMLKGWRDIICNTFTQNCPGNMKYSYNQTSCRKSCRSLSEIDHTCYLPYTPVDGCGCAENTYLNDMGECVPSSDCPCYVNNEIVAPMQVISKAGSTCTCRYGTLQCTGPKEVTTCTAPMVYFNCSQAAPGQKGTECQNICETLDSNPCMSTQCKSGCVCPNGLLADGQGGCVTKEQCPCVHNGAFYQPGETVKSDCNNCTCKNRKWICTKKECNKICTIYGDSHYISFDGRRYTFNGNCEYTLAQDYCRNSNEGSFRIITENIPCGTTGTTCAKSIKIFLGNKQLLLSEENIKSVHYDNGTEIPYKIHSVGIYLVIEAENSLTLIWDKKTSLMVKLGPSFKGEVCGLCGNYDGDWNNDFMTRGGEEVVEPTEFGNSWRVSATCPEASGVLSPCSMRPYRQAWAIRQCSILKSDVFSKCHTEVDPTQYYEACVQDTCACDAGGDCECFCTAVAAYAAECSGKGVCVMWRSPTICPLFCDYYNLNEGCEWHYKPCGQSCMKTCKNPTGVCYSEIPPLEGCFPQCPSDRPYLEEATMKCVAREECGCYDDESNTHYSVGDSIPTTLNCNKCYCTAQGPSCSYNDTDCYCEYNGQTYKTGQIIYHTTDGDGTCISAICGQNGTISRIMELCTTTPTPTPSTSPTVFNFTSTMETWSTTTQTPVSSTTIPGTTVTTVIPPTTTETVSTPTVETSSTTTQPPVSSTTILGTTVTTVIPPTTTETVSTPTLETSSTTTQPPDCQLCQWSEWLNNDYPSSTRNGKDIESISTFRNSGKISCEKPDEIQCRATQYKDTSLSDLGQKVICNVTVGLICNNIDQDDYHCFDYEIRVKCCDEMCPPTTTPTVETSSTTTQTPVSSTTIPSTTVTTVIPPTTTETVSTPTLETSSTTTQPPVSSTTTPSTTVTTVIPLDTTETVSTPTLETSSTTTQPPDCQLCQWSEWLNNDYPSSTRNGKDIESISTFRNSGKISCEKPDEIQCRATQYKDTSLSDLGQKVICNVTVGLICNNIDQDDYHCFDYEIRVKCCDEMCPPTTTPTVETSSTTTQTPVSSTTIPGTTVTTVIPPTTTETVSTPTVETSSTTTQPPVSSTTIPGTTVTTVIPPTTTETVSTPTVETSSTTTQTPVSSTTITSTTVTTVIPLDTTETVSTPTVETSSTTTQPPVSSTTIPGTTVTTVIPPTTTETVSTSTVETSSTTTQPPVSSTTIPSTTVTTVIPLDTTETVSTPTVETSSTTTQPPVSSTTTPSTTVTTVIPLDTTETVSTPTLETSSTTTQPPDCQLCQWSEWLNNDYPSSTRNGKDIESISTFRNSGKISCEKPDEIQCRATQYKDTSLSDLGQKVICNVTVGLICNNIDQDDYHCFDYEIRYSNYSNSTNHNRNSFYTNSGNIEHNHTTTCFFNNNSGYYSDYCNSTNHNRNSFYTNSGNIKHNHTTTCFFNNNSGGNIEHNHTNTCFFNNNTKHYSNYCNYTNHNRNSFYTNSGNIEHNHTTTCFFNNNSGYYSDYCNSTRHNRNSFYTNSGNIKHNHTTTCFFNNNTGHYSNYCNSTNHNRNSFYINSGNIEHNHTTTCFFNNNTKHYSNYCNSTRHNRNSFYTNSGNIEHNHTTTCFFNNNTKHYSNYSNSTNHNRNSFYTNSGNIEHNHTTTCFFNNNTGHYSDYCNSTNYNRNSFYTNSGNIEHNHTTT
ncbi:mucin-2 [Ictalurus furcatus]|uniref:mucin-2 n=1 Tax=Ictalurus furcatus TaxID=66913 RepID=UPI00234FC154|nr:mucin-2 [Ictalurus furcatus]